MADPQTALTLDIQAKENHFTLSLHEAGSSVQTLEDHPVLFDAIHATARHIYRLIQRANELGQFDRSVNTELTRAGRNLYTQCISRQIRDRLNRTRAEHLLIKLDESLLAVPWELMHTGDDFLCLQFNVGRQVRTRKTFRQGTRLKKRTKLQLLVLADPCGNLPAAQAEMRQLRRQLDPHKDRLNVATKSSRITRAYVDQHLHHYDIAHFAGHSSVDRTNPKQSGWELADGIWSLQDIQRLGERERQPSLIVSNSCQSAFNHQDSQTPTAADEISGIANAFIFNGVRHFVGTLWKVPDDSAGTFAARFYSELLRGATIGAALKMARQQMAPATGEHQLTWANYILYGDPSTVMFGKQTPRWTKAFVPVAAAAILFGTVAYVNGKRSIREQQLAAHNQASRQYAETFRNEEDALLKVVFEQDNVPKHAWETFISRNEDILRTIDGRKAPDTKAQFLKYNGDLHVERGDYFLAADHYQKALSYLPENGEQTLFLRQIILLDMVHAFIESGRLKPEATGPLEDFNKALAVYPDSFTDQQLSFLVRRLQIIRLVLFKRGMKNSRFYKDLSVIYNNLKITRKNLR